MVSKHGHVKDGRLCFVLTEFIEYLQYLDHFYFVSICFKKLSLFFLSVKRLTKLTIKFLGYSSDTVSELEKKCRSLQSQVHQMEVLSVSQSNNQSINLLVCLFVSVCVPQVRNLLLVVLPSA